MRSRNSIGRAGLAALLLLSSSPSHAADTALETIEFRIRIEPVFHLETDSKQAGIVQLGPLTPGDRQALDTARIIVYTNLRRPYRIVQYLGQELMSERGFSFQKVKYSVSNGIHGGHSEVDSLQPLTTEHTVIFSNKEGVSDQFTLSYFAAADEVIAAGHYRAPIVIEEETRSPHHLQVVG